MFPCSLQFFRRTLKSKSFCGIRLHGSVHSKDAWHWNAEQIANYVEKACLEPNPLTPSALQTSLHEHIWPLMLRMKKLGDPYVTDPSPGGQLVVAQVPSSFSNIKIPITDFCSALGYVISVAETPGYTEDWFFHTVAVYARWCYTIFGSSSWFGRHSRLPNTAHILWAKQQMKMTVSHKYGFSLSTTLPETVIHPRSHKNIARLVRVDALRRADRDGDFSVLMEESQSATSHRYQWGNCAETMNLISAFNTKESYGLAIQLKPVARGPDFPNLNNLIGRTRFACHRCRALVETAGHHHYDLRFVADRDTVVEEIDDYIPNSTQFYNRMRSSPDPGWHSELTTATEAWPSTIQPAFFF